MKKIISYLLIAVLSFGLMSCAGTGSSESATQDKIVSVAVNGNLSQDQDNMSAVSFTASLLQDEDEIEWYVNGVVQPNGSASFTFTPRVQGSYIIYCSTKNSTTNKERKSKKFTLTVFGKNLSVEIDAKNQSSEDLSISQYLNQVKAIEFEADFLDFSGITEAEAKAGIEWFVNEELLLSSKGKTEIEYTPENQVGNYDIYAMVNGEFKSNFKRIEVSLGKIEIIESGKLEQNTTNLTAVNFTYSIQGGELSDSCNWYVNDELYATSQSVILTPKAFDVLKVYAEISGVKSDVKYIISGTEVNTEQELQTAISEKVSAIYLNSDIALKDYSNNSHLTINYPLAIAGNGKKLLSEIGVSTVMSVNSSNVVIVNLKLEDAYKYALQFYKAKDCYIENVTLINSGYAGLHLNRSQVVVKNITVTEANYAGVELSHPDYDSTNPNDFPTIITILGDITFTDLELPAPIYSQYNEKSCMVISNTFTEFVVTGLVGSKEAVIRRWCNDGCNIGWTIVPPIKVDYNIGEKLNIQGISLTVSICGNSMIFDESYIGMAFNYNLEARFEFIGINGDVLYELFSNEVTALGELVCTNNDGEILNSHITDDKIVQIKAYLAGVYIGYYNINVSQVEQI